MSQGLELCRFGCNLRLRRQDMAAHAAVCPRVRVKRFPVCDKYCCRRSPLNYDALVKTTSKGKVRRTLRVRTAGPKRWTWRTE
eukprot:6195215-Pleurochrysis_carterae.AAC.1